MKLDLSTRRRGFAVVGNGPSAVEKTQHRRNRGASGQHFLVGNRLHPNDDNRYHINNTPAVKNEDSTFTFRFKVKCEDGDQNCLEVPAGPFDVAARYYLPEPEIMSGKWTIPKPVLNKFNKKRRERSETGNNRSLQNSSSFF